MCLYRVGVEAKVLLGLHILQVFESISKPWWPRRCLCKLALGKNLLLQRWHTYGFVLWA